MTCSRKGILMISSSNPFQYGVDFATRMKAEKPNDTVGSKIMEVYGVLAEMIARSGDGDHLEIGVWRGASAILAAKMKQCCGYSGMIVGLDDYDGYTDMLIKTHVRMQRPERLELVCRHAEEYNVRDRIELIMGTTVHFPEQLTTRKFATAFIDGNHWDEWPYDDFCKVEPMVEKYIMFDDYDDKHLAVVDAVARIAHTHDEWRLVYVNHNSAIVERVTG